MAVREVGRGRIRDSAARSISASGHPMATGAIGLIELGTTGEGRNLGGISSSETPSFWLSAAVSWRTRMSIEIGTRGLLLIPRMRSSSSPVDLLTSSGNPAAVRRASVRKARPPSDLGSRDHLSVFDAGAVFPGSECGGGGDAANDRRAVFP